ncbi:MAG: NAD(P)-dependent oxidoreductase, partial [Elusimicrobia bacterium]|nr:NAD(P)-dependent oxidoreductase [Elusimicrobiota bacterium]
MSYDFVTGATGCVGRHVVAGLLAKGRSLICAVRHPYALSNDPLFQSPRLRLIPCDFTHDGWERMVQAGLSHCDHIFHLAGEMPHRPTCHFNPRILRKVNLEAVEKLSSLAYQNGIKKFLYMSSVAVYGDMFAQPRDESSVLEPINTYAATKVKAERCLIQMAQRGGPSALIVRPGFIYGDWDNGAINKMISLIAQRCFVVIGRGDNRRALSSVALLTDALLALSQSHEGISIVNVVDPVIPTLKRLTEDIAALLGVAPPRCVPKALIYPAASVFSVLAYLGWGTSLKLSDVR